MDPAENQEQLATLRFGPYLTPVIAVGTVVECEVRGLVTVVGLSDAPIPWPLGERDGERQPIVFKALARAVRQEAPTPLAAAWGVSTWTAFLWKAACRSPRQRKKQPVSSPLIPWKNEDDELIARLSLSEAARLTGRTLTAVRKRRRALGLPDGRKATERDARSDTQQHVDEVRRELRAWTSELTHSVAELRETFRRAKATVAYWNIQPAILHNRYGKALKPASAKTSTPPASPGA
jgi:hypothetical protein